MPLHAARPSAARSTRPRYPQRGRADASLYRGPICRSSRPRSSGRRAGRRRPPAGPGRPQYTGCGQYDRTPRVDRSRRRHSDPGRSARQEDHQPREAPRRPPKELAALLGPIGNDRAVMVEERRGRVSIAPLCEPLALVRPTFFYGRRAVTPWWPRSTTVEIYHRGQRVIRPSP